MDFKELIHWLEEQRGQPGGNITVVQTLRNAIMAASVLASAALVALMGVLATSSLHPRLTVASATGMLVLSCFFIFSHPLDAGTVEFSTATTRPHGAKSG
jgi:hypothetical protein